VEGFKQESDDQIWNHYSYRQTINSSGYKGKEETKEIKKWTYLGNGLCGLDGPEEEKEDFIDDFWDRCWSLTYILEPDVLVFLTRVKLSGIYFTC
jgi:hypothetical protein